MMWQGAFTALITPFKRGAVDYPKLRELLAYQISAGINGVVVCATTGEGPTLAPEEKVRIIRETVRAAHGKIPVVAYTGTNDTRYTVKFTKAATALKIDGALVVTPYYNKPSQEGLYRHFQAVADAVRLPIILYNVPGRTVVSLAPETIARLGKIKNIVAVKNATTNLEEISQLRRLSEITILSGEDALTYPMLALGARGVISVAANIIPREISRLVKLYQEGAADESRAIHEQIFPLVKALFLETNPVPVKAALQMLGRLNGELRLPLVPMSTENQAKLQKVLAQYKRELA